MNLTTTYVGLELRTPIMASASPLTGELDTLKALVDAGASAVVLPSLFEEQIVHESLEVHGMLEMTGAITPEAPDGFFPELDDYNTGPDRYLEMTELSAGAVDVPVIASLNGVSRGGWLKYARQLESAGATALELNTYRIAASVDDDPRTVERELVELVGEVASSISIPLAVKLSPYYSAMANLAVQLQEAGAAGLVLFNRFYQPDIDIETRTVVPRLVLSDEHELLLPLRWVAILRGRVDVSLAVTSGIHDGTGVAKALLAGADVAMMASALLRNGPSHIRLVEGELRRWMTEQEYDSVEQLKGSVSQQAVKDPGAFERANYLQTLTSYSASRAL